MAEKKGANTPRKDLEQVFDFMEGCENDELTKPIDEVRDELQRDGLDSTQLKRFARERLLEIRAADKLQRARAERYRLDRLRLSITAAKRERGPQLREQVGRLLQGLSAHKSPQAEVLFRKFKNATDDDLLSLLDDIEFLNAKDHEPED